MAVTGVVSTELSPRPTRTRSKLSAVALCALFTAALGTSTAVAVAASPACEQLVRTYVDRVVRNLVSPATLRRWREWGVKHPNWHPSLHAAARPKFKKVRDLKVAHMQLACPILTDEIAMLPANLDNFLLPAAAPVFEQAVNAPLSAPIQSFQTPLGSTPAAVAVGGGGGAVGGGGGAPGGSTPSSAPVLNTPVSTPVPITPADPVTAAPVPEPSPILLTLTGMAAIAAFSCFRRKPAESRLSA